MVSANHHLDSVSTSLEKTAQQNFYPAGPISGKRSVTHAINESVYMRSISLYRKTTPLHCVGRCSQFEHFVRITACICTAIVNTIEQAQ